MMKKTYTDLIKIDNYNDRLNYLRSNNKIGVQTFGASRIFNQMFYRSKEWKSIRDKVILRDMGCDLGIKELPIQDVYKKVFDRKLRRYVDKKINNIVIHHIESITLEDLENKDPKLFDMDNLITCSLETHNQIHYGIVDEEDYIIRTRNDTCPWKR